MVFQFNPFDMDDSMFSSTAAPIMLDWFGGGYQPYVQSQYRAGRPNYPSWNSMYGDCDYSPRQNLNSRSPNHANKRDIPMEVPLQNRLPSFFDIPSTTARGDQWNAEEPYRQQINKQRNDRCTRPFANDIPVEMPADTRMKVGDPNRLHANGPRNQHDKTDRQKNNGPDKKVWNKEEGCSDEKFENGCNSEAMMKLSAKSKPGPSSDTRDSECESSLHNISSTGNVHKLPVGVMNRQQTLKSSSNCSKSTTSNEEMELPNVTEAEDIGKEINSMDHKPQLYKKLKENGDNLDNLKLRIDAFRGTTKDKEYIFIDELLTKVLLSLDAIETNGIEEIRSARKKLVQRVQELVLQLEHKAKSHHVEEVTMAASGTEPTEMNEDESISKPTTQGETTASNADESISIDT